MKTLPKYIALCGWPKSGKDTVADEIARQAGAFKMDDGLVLRRACPILFGYDKAFPFSQEGKATLIDLPDGQETVREGLGELGKWLEDRYGEQFLPWRAIRMAQTHEAKTGTERYLFSSVRKTQGLTYKKNGGVVIQVRRPGVNSSPFDFDKFDESLVDVIFENDGTMEDIPAKVSKLLEQL